MDPLDIIKQYFKPNTKAYNILLSHSEAVTEKCLAIANNNSNLNADIQFITEAAMLHDIGIIKTNTPRLGCFGPYRYICHGYLGSEILANKGFPEHALVCERHTGVGLTIEDIEEQGLPIPFRDYVPLSVEEQIICFADTFFSKNNNLKKEKSVKEVLNSIKKFGPKNTKRFNEWCNVFL
jgi:uncharacterized protein